MHISYVQPQNAHVIAHKFPPKRMSRSFAPKRRWSRGCINSALAASKLWMLKTSEIADNHPNQ